MAGSLGDIWEDFSFLNWTDETVKYEFFQLQSKGEDNICDTDDGRHKKLENESVEGFRDEKQDTTTE